MIPGKGSIERLGLEIEEPAEEFLGAGGFIDRERGPAEVGQDDPLGRPVLRQGASFRRGAVDAGERSIPFAEQRVNQGVARVQLDRELRVAGKLRFGAVNQLEGDVGVSELGVVDGEGLVDHRIGATLQGGDVADG